MEAERDTLDRGYGAVARSQGLDSEILTLLPRCNFISAPCAESANPNPPSSPLIFQFRLSHLLRELPGLDEPVAALAFCGDGDGDVGDASESVAGRTETAEPDGPIQIP